MMKVGGREEWLASAATGKVERRGPFSKGVLDCKTHIVAAIVNAASVARDGKVKAAAAGRNLLDLGEDSDSSSSSEEPDNDSKPNPLNGILHAVKYKGLEFKAVLVGRLVHVEARADVAQIIAEACIKETIRVIAEETNKKRRRPSSRPTR